jgi:hypothetical protein
MRAVWDMSPCTLVEVDRNFRISTASNIAMMMQTVRTSETSVHFNESTDVIYQKAVIFIPSAVRT